MTRIDLETDPVVYRNDGILEYEGEPFTGEVVEQLGDQLIAQQFYVDGIPHGPDREWWVDGGPKSEGEIRHGMPTGIYRAWHRNGQLAEEREFADDGRVAVLRRWDEDGNPIEVAGRRARPGS